MSDRRRKDVDWAVADERGNVPTWERIGIAVMMDVRDELKRLNALLYCGNAVAVPSILRTIAANTKPKRRKAKRKAAR